MARNVHQIAGEDLKTPVTMVICWTPGGSGKGGTGQALRMASYLKIPIIDLGDETLTIAAQIARINEILGVEQPKPKGLFG